MRIENLKATFARFVSVSLLVLAPAARGGEAGFDLEAVAQAARKAPSIYLTDDQKESVVRSFVKLVSTRSPSGQEAVLREALRQQLAGLQAVEIAHAPGDAERPCNLVMELSASRQDREKPGILLNAHLDTIASSDPELLRYDVGAADFYHANEKAGGRGSSFGADDKAGVAVIVGCLSVLQERYWSTNAPHRRIVIALTAEEETGCVGARYLAAHHPEVFENLDLSLTFDGPLDFRSEYPAVSFVTVVSEEDAQRQPYRAVIELLAQVAEKKHARYARTEMGLGMGDFAQFPKMAHAGLHIRSPQRGFHRLERAKVSDFINHVDLLCHILLKWDRRGELNRP